MADHTPCREEIARLTRERDAAQEECHRLLAPLRDRYDRLRAMLGYMTRAPAIGGTVEVAQCDLLAILRHIEACAVQLEERTRERDAARAECRVSRELLDENGYPYVNLDETVGPRLKAAIAANQMEDK